MGREIKFRVWSLNEKLFHYFDVYEGCSGIYGATAEPQQFTGLKSKNGKEIFEGDIVTGYFDMGPAGFIKHTAPIEFNLERGYQWEYWELKSLEVIGNIFENPDLLK